MKRKKKQTKEQQMDMGFKDPFGNKIAHQKSKFSKKLQILETKRFVRAPHSWIFIGMGVTLTAIQLYFVINFFEILPPKVPLYLNSIDLGSRLGSKSELFLIPGLSIIIIAITALAGYQLFNSRRELIIFSLVNMLVSVGILTFVLLRLFSTYI